MSMVYVVDSGDYEQNSVDLVGVSVQACVDRLKEVYVSPYIVEWGELKDCGDQTWCVQGKFTEVLGYSTGHTETFSITEYELCGSTT